MFDRLFGKKRSTDKPPLPVVLDYTIGREVSIDPTFAKLLPQDSLLDILETTFMISAQGHCDLGEQSHLHRFYDMDDRILLQVQGGNGFEDVRVDEIMLWAYHDVAYPGSDSAWNAFRNAIRQPVYTLQAGEEKLLFERIWFGEEEGPTDPMTYWETVSDDLEGGATRRIFQTAMLFARQLGDGSDEFLLMNMEEPVGGDRSVTAMIGRPLTRHQLNV